MDADDDVGGSIIFSASENASAEMNADHYIGGFPELDEKTNDTPSFYEEEPVMNGTAWNDTLQCWLDPVTNVTSCEPLDMDIYSLGFKVVVAILYNFIFVAALLGNALVCYVVFSTPRMRTVTNYLIANLAIGDLLMAVLCVPFSYIPILLQYWPFGNFLCYLLSPAQAITVLVSSYTLVALAADRYMAILYPLRPRFRRSQACWVIVVVWLIAIITASPIAIFTEYFQDNTTGYYYCDESGWKRMGVEKFKLPYSLTLMILQYFFPLTVLIFTYSRIAMAVWGKKSLGEAEDSRDQRLAKTKRKTVVMSLVVVCGYTLAWLPFNLLMLVGPEAISWYPQYFFFACHFLAMAHTTYNPVIYAWMNVRFRTAFLSVLSRLNLLCPCLLTVCQAKDSRNNTITTYNSTINSNHHHSLRIHQHQQISNNKKQPQQPNNKNVMGSRSAYQLTQNGSVKSTLESDPTLVLISKPTDQIVKTQNQVIKNTNNGNMSTSPGSIKENNLHKQSPLNNCHNTAISPKLNNHQIATAIIIKKNNSHSSSVVLPVELLATARVEDLMPSDGNEEEEGNPEQEPVWT